ncbi:hypothetical protein NUW58_g8066 [Xylaria curta]|uniref:Uncharacterized protein n=1 Tax=Xylaria curta TaxID=42375 RepID=A0ACC1NBW6_9PEZI|nr:hypothetical protein NUW58_g8066 [Xylaria curta]
MHVNQSRDGGNTALGGRVGSFVVDVAVIGPPVVAVSVVVVADVAFPVVFEPVSSLVPVTWLLPPVDCIAGSIPPGLLACCHDTGSSTVGTTRRPSSIGSGRLRHHIAVDLPTHARLHRGLRIRSSTRHFRRHRLLPTVASAHSACTPGRLAELVETFLSTPYTEA